MKRKSQAPAPSGGDPPRSGPSVGRENSLERSNLAARILSACVSAVVGADNEADLLTEICRIIVDQGGYRMAWVGYAVRDAARSVRPVGRAGHDEGYVDRVDISWADDERGRGPTGTAIRTGRSTVCRDIESDPHFAPWRADALARGYRSSVVVPMRATDGSVFAALNIYAEAPHAFDGASVDLLCKLADSLAFGVMALRAREDRARMVDHLRQDEERFHAIFEASPAGLCVVDSDGCIRLVNARVEELFQWSAQELVGRSIDVLVPEAAAEPHAEHRRTYLEKPQVRRMGDRPEYGARRKDGSGFPVEVSLHPIAMQGSRMILATIADISERQRAEAELRRKEQLFNELTDTIPDRIYFKDRQSRFVRINARMAQDFGLREPAEAVGKTDFDIFGSEHARRAFDDEQRIMATGESLIGIEEMETWPDGRVTWSSTTKVALRDEAGTITGLVGISRDITRRKQLEAQFMQSQKMEIFGQLAGGVAHDFNNILSAMLMTIGMLQTDPFLTSELAAGLADLQLLTKRGSSLTRQLLVFSRPRNLEVRPLDLNALLREFGRMVARVLGGEVDLHIETSPGTLLIEADAGNIEQVIMNLCVNARDAMPRGGRLLVRTQRAAKTPPDEQGDPRAYVSLAVEDNGCGMDEATRSKIFEPFFTTKPAGKGTGLGLATVYTIVKQHGGWIEVVSAPGQGSTFILYFPEHQPAEKPAASTAGVGAGSA